MPTIFYILFILVIVAVVIIAIKQNGASPMWIDDEDDFEETTVTEETITHEVQVVGNLQRKLNDDGQPFVIDPVDGKEWKLNTSDDMYEDAAGKIWRVVI